MKKFALFGIYFLLLGCSFLQPKDIAKPSEITIQKALADVGTGLNDMLKNRGEKSFGLIPSEIEVTFNVKAGAKEEGSLVLDLSRKSTPTDLVNDVKIRSELKNSSEASKDNKITIKFVNILMIPQKTLAYEKPDNLKIILESADKNKIIILDKPGEHK